MQEGQPLQHALDHELELQRAQVKVVEVALPAELQREVEPAWCRSPVHPPFQQLHNIFMRSNLLQHRALHHGFFQRESVFSDGARLQGNGLVVPLCLLHRPIAPRANVHQYFKCWQVLSSADVDGVSGEGDGGEAAGAVGHMGDEALVDELQDELGCGGVHLHGPLLGAQAASRSVVAHAGRMGAGLQVGRQGEVLEQLVAQANRHGQRVPVLLCQGGGGGHVPLAHAAGDAGDVGAHALLAHPLLEAGARSHEFFFVRGGHC
mmetsp:Transcript_31608/g.79278  ORF Transcript_31608/g.79278 Transcript_31608/m.79278 type:complete len:263 (-) Transcript_31608:187-975(-)